MLNDIRCAYKAREEQLASAARNYKKRMKDIYKKHEMLLIAYRSQREQILGLKNEDLDAGPSEVEFVVTDSELLSGQAQELNRLREDKACLESQLRNGLEQVKGSGEMGGDCWLESETRGKVNDGNWMELKKQMREFTLTTQEELESERGQLSSRLKVTEGQLAELQDYVDKHLGRYKEEIVRLRKLIGSEVPLNYQC
uniref:Coiled-coil domain-containing protein 78 n=1 Tax=Callorhinchus milii TaxID=7868 RepID=A0A4W3HI96_CALMI